MANQTTTVTTEMLERLADAFNVHDANAVMSFFAEDCEMLAPRGPDPRGPPPASILGRGRGVPRLSRERAPFGASTLPTGTPSLCPA